MRHLISALTAGLFFIWILPLGVFIKPSQEKTACDGQRAICMCQHSVGKAKVSTASGEGIKSNSASNKESSPSGIGNYFLTFNANAPKTFHFARLAPGILLAKSEIFLKSIEHVPKA